MLDPAVRTALLAVSAALVAPAAAPAAVLPVQRLDGPAADIGELGGVALARDGTGGVVFLRAVEGRQHVWVSRYDGRRWWAPVRVDTDSPYEARAARIGAAEGGRLVVVWARPTAGEVEGLFSATLPTRSLRWLPPTVVDFNIGSGLTAAPSLAMGDGGAALLTYRVIPDSSGAGLPTGFVKGEVRVARYNRSRWQRLGAPANRSRAAPLPAPSADNAPRVAVDAHGNGAVVWQEPDDELIPRVWARRIFGMRYGVARAASPLQSSDAPVRGGADRPALAMTEHGRVVVAYRQHGDPRDRSATPQLAVTRIEEDGASFTPPTALGPAGDAPAAVDVAATGTLLGFSRAGIALLGFAPDVADAVAVRERDGAVPLPAPVVAAGVDGRGVLASASEAGGGEVAVNELEGAEVVERQPITTTPGGPIRELAAAGNGLGDALVAFAQGVDGDRQIGVATVDTAPARFALELPVGWTRARRPVLRWSPSEDALGPVTYTVSIGGRRIARTGSTWLRLREGTLREGRHTVRVMATDALGQRTLADAGSYRLDRQAPLAAVTVRGRRATVRLRDPGDTRASGMATGASSVSWGDGRSTEGFKARARHTFRRRGSFTLTISTADNAGNRVVHRRAVRIG